MQAGELASRAWLHGGLPPIPACCHPAALLVKSLDRPAGSDPEPETVCSEGMPTPHSIEHISCSRALHICLSLAYREQARHMMSCCMQVRQRMPAAAMRRIMHKGSASYQLSPQSGVVCPQLADLQERRQHQVDLWSQSHAAGSVCEMQCAAC